MADAYDDDISESPEKETSGDKNTALLRTSFFPEKPEPGKVYKVRVEKVYEGQASVTYVHESDKEDEDVYDEAPPETGVLDEISEMMA